MRSISKLDQYAANNGLPVIPASTCDREGLSVRLRDGTLRMNLKLASGPWPGNSACAPIAYAVRRWLIHRFEVCAAGTVVRDLKVLRTFLKDQPWLQSNGEGASANEVRRKLAKKIVRYLDGIRQSDVAQGRKLLEPTLERLRGFYAWCLTNSIPGFDESGLSLLRGVKAPGRKNGESVMSWDPSKGPLTRLEELQFRKALMEDSGPLRERVACWLTYGMGLRPKQIILLLESDLHIYVATNGERFYQLEVPRVKKKGIPDRSATKRRKIGPQLGKMIEELIFQNRDIQTKAGVNRSLILLNNAVEQRLGGDERVWANRVPENFVKNALADLVERAKLVSIRTKKPMNVTPRRLRYTFATNKAEYCTPAELAELLDHSDLRSVLVYYNSRETIGQEIGEKLSRSSRYGGYRSVIDALAGIPIRVVSGDVAREKHGHEMTRFAPHEMLKGAMRTLPGLGSCAGKYKCGSPPIVTCYACDEFEAWDDADHGAFADWLEEETTHLRQQGQASESTLAEFEIAYFRADRLRRELRRNKRRGHS